MLKFLNIQMMRNTRMVRSSTMMDTAVLPLCSGSQLSWKEQPQVPYERQQHKAPILVGMHQPALT